MDMPGEVNPKTYYDELKGPLFDAVMKFVQKGHDLKMEGKSDEWIKHQESDPRGKCPGEEYMFVYRTKQWVLIHDRG